jgi:hypothetical protein
MFSYLLDGDACLLGDITTRVNDYRAFRESFSLVSFMLTSNEEDSGLKGHGIHASMRHPVPSKNSREQ